MKKILILFSDTGGGHRAGAEAIKAALEELYPGQVDIMLTDGFKELGTMIGKIFPPAFPFSVKYGRKAWEIGYRLTNRSYGARIMSSLPLTKEWKQYLQKNNPDLIVSCHALLATPAINGLRRIKKENCPVVPVILDLISMHHAWIAPDAHSYVVPTQETCNRVIESGIDASRVKLLGMPLHPKFSKISPAPARTATDPVRILVTGGGDGIGAMPKYLKALDQVRQPLQINVVCGRNRRLQHDISEKQFKHPVNTLGFISNIEEFMRTSDIILAKAGPFAVSESIICGKPIILYDFIPGLEEGNILFVERYQVGRYIQHPNEMQAAINWCLSQADSVADRSKTILDARASYAIARYLVSIIS
ncbi:MAG TPA: glycosyltransferase [bacterium]|nr:glycosyltransferase [bacterium]